MDEHDKIHNKDIHDYSNIKIIDNEVKKKFGYLFKQKDFTNIDIIIKNAIENFEYKSKNIENFTNENFFNFGKTKKFLKKNLDKIF